MTQLEYARYGTIASPEPHPSMFKCPRSTDADPYVDADYCESFVKGKGCVHKELCPAYQQAKGKIYI